MKRINEFITTAVDQQISDRLKEALCQQECPGVINRKGSILQYNNEKVESAKNTENMR